MKKILPFTSLLLILFPFRAFNSEIVITQKLQWNAPVQIQKDSSPSFLLNFTNAYYPSADYLPFYQQSVFFPFNHSEFISLEIKNLVFDSTDVSQYIGQSELSKIGHELIISSNPAQSRNQIGVHISFVPLIIDQATRKVFKLIDFEFLINYRHNNKHTQNLKQTYTSESVLATGNWFKFAVSETGVHKITYNDLVSAGLNPAGINPQHLRLFGNGGGMLPESNAGARYDDLVENSIIVVGEDDGVFNTQDYILFFGQSPHVWKYSPSSATFEHQNNIYTNHNYYFLTASKGVGKRIGIQPNSGAAATYTVNMFNDYQVHDKNDENLLKSGRNWYGEKFDAVLTKDFSFNFPNRITDSAFYVRSNVAANSLQSTYFVFNINETSLQINISPVSSGNYPPIARESNLSRTLKNNQATIDINLTYNKSSLPSVGWLNYIWLHALRQLKMSGDQMTFRSLHSVKTGRVSEFRIGNANTSLAVWDVTDPTNVSKQDVALQGNEMTFSLSTDLLREFIAFDPSKTLSVEFVEKVLNQNLHGVDVPDMLIITHPLFLNEANRLADFHAATSGFDVLVVNIFQIYNEFSSGKQDVAAIRDFVRMLYNRDAEENKFLYLLLFGDASFDYLDRLANNTNYVPGWMSPESLEPVESYISDDFFGFLDINEGGTGTNILDLGIGRLPAATVEQAAAMVDKIIHYSDNIQSNLSDWRNYICLIADDEDGNMHMRDAEILADVVSTSYNYFNLTKIYLDAYPQISVPGGKRYPQVNADINKRIQQGALIVNYIGHGGVLGLAHERVLEINDINSWTNYDKMPVFITATCEFAYFDNPSHTSPGELVLLNPKGGGIALFTTTRPTYASFNFPLNKRLFEYSFQRINGEYPRLGDIMRLAKQNSGNDVNARKFVLLGDPAIRMALPSYHVNTTHVNETDINIMQPILRALALITVKGNISDINGNIINDFNGTIIPVIFDKAQKIVTLANDGGNAFSFESLQNNVYKGKASVINGEFNFSFIMPKDIAYAYGAGKISYYATDGTRDAHGADERIIIGGFNELATADNKGPEIKLFINDQKFKSGGITDENPTLLAIVSDTSGINTTGIGIGHDITAVLNYETDKAYFLNDFYQADLDTYKSGTIQYPFYRLPDGRHYLSLKVWDIHNNPSEESIEFIVATSGKIALQEILNYPNPFGDQTKFVIEHNQAGEIIEFELLIYSLDGRLRKSLKEKTQTGNYRSELFTWDGKGDDGQLLESGTYIYKVVMQNQNTGRKETGNKLVIIR